MERLKEKLLKLLITLVSYGRRMKYTEKLYREAEEVATLAHMGQKYGKIFPYTKHLRDVVEILKSHGYAGPYIIAGWLHDVIEDGNVSYNDIKNHFGEYVAEIVYCVTDELGRNRHERKIKTLKKTANLPPAIVVKLADRLANVQSGGKIDMYVEEYGGFRNLLFPFSNSLAAPLWRSLDEAMGYKGDSLL